MYELLEGVDKKKLTNEMKGLGIEKKKCQVKNCDYYGKHCFYGITLKTNKIDKDGDEIKPSNQ